jgi:hypothetical protein
MRRLCTCAHLASRPKLRRPEFHLARLLQDIQAIAQDHSPTDPIVETTRLYCRLTAAEVHGQFVKPDGHTEERLPSVQTMGGKLNALGLRLRKAAKCRSPAAARAVP